MPQGSNIGRIIGIDYGEVRIGVAVSDELQVVARAVATLHCSRMDQTLAALAQMAMELQATRVVVGLPINMNGTQGQSAQRVRSFVEDLKQTLSLPVSFVDERLSTREVDEWVAAQRGQAREGIRRRGTVPGRDACAAAVILQRYLNGETE